MEKSDAEKEDSEGWRFQRGDQGKPLGDGTCKKP